MGLLVGVVPDGGYGGVWPRRGLRGCGLWVGRGRERSLQSALLGVADLFPCPERLVLGGVCSLGMVFCAGARVHPTRLVHC